MNPVPSFRLLLAADDPTAKAEVCAFLDQAGAQVTLLDLTEAGGADLTGQDLVLIDASRQPEVALPLCHRLRTRAGEAFFPILCITGDNSPRSRLACIECGADAYLLRPFDPAELLAQVQAFVRLKDRHDSLIETTAEVHRINKRLQSAYQQIDQELELARRIQESFLPQSLPVVPQVRFAVHYQPCGRVGGDFYDVFRLDEKHLGFYVADAMGHGVPASLLTVFVKRGVKPKDINGSSYRLVPPGEVLGRLNRDLIEQALSENPFITMAYVLLNMQTGTLQFARSGHPYPLYVPVDGPPRLWQVEGSLLGVFDTQFPDQAHHLRPGDKVVLYTDGMDSASIENHPVGISSLLAGAARFRTLPIQELVDRLAHDLFGQTRQSDDLTVLGLEVLK